MGCIWPGNHPPNHPCRVAKDLAGVFISLHKVPALHLLRQVLHLDLFTPFAGLQAFLEALSANSTVTATEQLLDNSAFDIMK